MRTNRSRNSRTCVGIANIAGVAIAIHFGFTATTLVAGGCYVVALMHAGLGRWPEPGALHEPK